MKTIVALVSVLFAATAAGQSPAPLEQPPDVQIVKHTWSKLRVDWNKTPFGKQTEISDLRSRRGSILEERQARETKNAQDKPTEPPRYVFQYKVTIVNASAKSIAEVDWDYLFTDAATGEELGRREFTSVEKVGAGKRKELSVTVSAPPARRISVYNLGKNERDGLAERIIIRRILYDDGTTWQASGGRMNQ